MPQRTWFITGISSGFGRHLADQLLERGDCVVGTVRDSRKVADLIDRHPDTFHAERLDVTDIAAIRQVVERSFARQGRIDVVISNAGYGLFGAAEELSDTQIDHMIATNLVGSIQLIRAVLPHLRAQGGGRVIQLSSYGGQVALSTACQPAAAVGPPIDRNTWRIEHDRPWHRPDHRRLVGHRRRLCRPPGETRP